MRDFIPKITKAKKGWGIFQEVECLASRRLSAKTIVPPKNKVVMPV
jgi:hypothetical protein